MQVLPQPMYPGSAALCQNRFHLLVTISWRKYSIALGLEVCYVNVRETRFAWGDSVRGVLFLTYP